MWGTEWRALIFFLKEYAVDPLNDTSQKKVNNLLSFQDKIKEKEGGKEGEPRVGIFLDFVN